VLAGADKDDGRFGGRDLGGRGTRNRNKWTRMGAITCESDEARREVWLHEKRIQGIIVGRVEGKICIESGLYR
jgi:hypothetical protein